jgi:hypothetical protein
MRGVGAGCLALSLVAGVGDRLSAQAPPDPPKFWVDHLYPYIYYSSVDGFWFAGHYDRSSPMGLARPEPNFARIAFDAGASTQGSYSVVLDAQAPAYWEGWRIALTLSAIRANRLGYYGQGNSTHYDRDSITALRPYFYRVSRTTRSARATVQRRIVGPLRVLIGGTLDHSDFRNLPGETLFQRDQLDGTIAPGAAPFNDRVVRAGVVVDWRDLEVDPHRGVFAEALVAGGRGYKRTTASLRAYAHPIDRLVLAGRIAGERMSGSPPVSAQQTMESSEAPFVAVGGYRSLRGYHDGRFTGAGKLLGGVEARYGLAWAPRVLELKLFAFYDVGRVFDSREAFRITTKGLHSSLGGGVALSLMRNSLVVVAVGKGSESTEVTFSTSWSF